MPFRTWWWRLPLYSTCYNWVEQKSNMESFFLLLVLLPFVPSLFSVHGAIGADFGYHTSFRLRLLHLEDCSIYWHPYSWEMSPLACMLAGRLLGGVGAASSALGYGYLAKVVPHDEQTKVNSLLSMLRIVGMALGPGVNVFLDKINVNIGTFHLDELNSVGLVLIGMNVLGFLSILLLLEEPAVKEDDAKQDGTRHEMEKNSSALSLLRTCCCAEICVPILTIFGFNANFQL